MAEHLREWLEECGKVLTFPWEGEEWEEEEQQGEEWEEEEEEGEWDPTMGRDGAEDCEVVGGRRPRTGAIRLRLPHTCHLILDT